MRPTIVVAIVTLFAYIYTPAFAASRLPRNSVAQAAACTASTGGATFTSADAQALRDAVAAASASGFVEVSGVCEGAVFERGSVQTLIVDKPLTIAGPVGAPAEISVKINGVIAYGRVISASAALVLENLVIRDGLIDDTIFDVFAAGAAIYSSRSALTLRNVTIRDNLTRHGPAPD
jgi:hypothetical protein